MKFLTRKILILILLTTTISPFTAIARESDFFVSTNAGSLRSRIKIENFNRTELFFGRNKPDGTEITEEEFTAFLDEIITPEFPEGLTVLDGIGQFRDAKGKIIQEKAKVLVLIYSSKMRRQNNRKIERIRNAYKKRFQQESVLRVESVLPVKVSF